MRIATIVLRSLLGLIFVVFGLNGFLHFIKNPPVTGAALQFWGGLAATGYMLPLIFGAQVLGGALLLTGTMVPFGLVILAPVIVNIFSYHVVLARDGLPVATVVCLIELFLAWRNWGSFAPIFARSSGS
jgi:uncharacterized membrane protein YphA (DoxX/SURF4 family)